MNLTYQLSLSLHRILRALAFGDVRGNGEDAWFVLDFDPFGGTQADSFLAVLATKAVLHVANGAFGLNFF